MASWQVQSRTTEEANHEPAQQPVFITGGSRGIGRAIANLCPETTKTQENRYPASDTTRHHPHGRCQIRNAGGQALPLVLDVRDERQDKRKTKPPVTLAESMPCNNAGAIRLTGVENLKVSRYDLMHQVNAQAVFTCSQAALPWLKAGGHILSLSPPLNLNTRWFSQYGPYDHKTE